MRFYTGRQFPDAYRNNVFIAEHGSWNRSKKIGYRVVRVVLMKVCTSAVAASQHYRLGYPIAAGRAWL
jgi:glucose/arabinose dehydrogenase